MEIKNLKDIEEAITKNSSNLEDVAVNQLSGIIKDLPPYISSLIEEAFTHQRIPKEYLLGSIFFAFSNAAGLAFRIDALGYSNYANIYMALIGSRGDVKSPAIDVATAPLNDYDNKQYQEHTAKLKEGSSEEPPIRKQLFIQDATIEAAYYKHYQNPYSIGILMDELYPIIEKMGNPSSKDGPLWRQLLLQGSTNKFVDVIRKTMESYRLSKSYPTLLGSIQQEFIPKIFAGGNMESGLTDRFFFTPSLTQNPTLSKYSMSLDCLKNYSDNLLRVMEHRKTVEDHQNIDEPYVFNCSPDAEEKLFQYTQNSINLQKDAEGKEKGYLAKQQINIHKILLLLHLIKSSAGPELCLRIEPKTVDEAVRVMDFYFTNFQIIMEKLDGKANKLDPDEIVKFGMRNNATQEQIAAVLGVHKSTISRKMAKIKI